MREAKRPNASPAAARDAAFRAVYAMRVGNAPIEDALSEETLGETFAPELRAYVGRLVSAAQVGGDSEGRLVPHLAGQWEIDRLALTDRILLAMASHELWSEPQIPPKVTISEYVKLADLYGTADSRRFLNGVLGSLVLASPKAQWTPPAEMDPVPVADRTETEAGTPEVPEPEEENREGSEERSTSRWILKSDG
ncbi:MAG: transcription antitermination protein NusB [Armatimonadetes bacterium]|nr:transcription antitermination protein NusB [Armatimonadota bacterium]